ncbi:MAG: Nudix family hydrolase [Chromatiaceae bacterium]|nr:Nudix family hydrolase [Chromatiaceae bacterium]
MPTLIHVAAAALIDPEGRVLLARRHADSHQGGLWEFPGGKLEPDEPVADGLRRELHEELGIDIIAHRPLIRITHHYPDRSVLLDVHRVDAWRGDPGGREGQPLAWVAPAELAGYPMPAADVPIVAALQLPSRYLITPPQLGDQAAFLDALEASLASGIRLVQLRLFDLSQDALLAVGRKARALCHAYHARVLLNGSPESAQAIGADGLHLNSRQLHGLRTRPIPADRLLAASCHSPADLAQAVHLGADFALLSPVLPTRSHPDAEPLGWRRFAEWVNQVPLPVYALGGMHPGLIEQAWQHGAQGVAGIRGLWVDEPAR